MLWHSFSDDTCYYGTSLSESSDIFFDLFEPLDDGDINKPKKCVTFSDKMAITYLFRPNSSILGRREKNQKKAKKKKERALKKLSSLENNSSLDDDSSALFGKKINDEIEIVKAAIAMQRCGISTYEDNYSSSTDVDTSSSGCDTSASDCSADETNVIEEEHLDNNYEDECKTATAETKNCNNKSKRKNRRRRRNRENKLTMKTFLETGGYDSE